MRERTTRTYCKVLRIPTAKPLMMSRTVHAYSNNTPCNHLARPKNRQFVRDDPPATQISGIQTTVWPWLSRSGHQAGPVREVLAQDEAAVVEARESSGATTVSIVAIRLDAMMAEMI